MPYTQSFLEEQLKKGGNISIGWPWKLFTFSAIAFTTMIAVFLGIKLGYQSYVKTQLEKVDQNITQLNASFSEEQEKNFMVFYSQLNNIQSLIQDRRLASAFFDFLEKNTIKSVYYRNTNFDFKNSEVKLDGIAPNYEIISQQMEIFGKSSQIVRVVLNSSKMSDIKGEGIIFSIRMNFNLLK
ncbi:MAG: PilN domain-containing protein [Patescibacteria group bacterium]|nr:PilN domain-containing protein [Patescibacteria group bacterium]